MRTLTVVCPVHNEAEVVELFYARLKGVLDEVADRYSSTILFVDDGSSDGSLDILKQIGSNDPDVRVVSLSTRFGHQMALVAGMDHCTSDAVIMMDTDLQHPPELIPRLLEEFERGNDIVWTIRTDTVGSSWFRRSTSRLFYRLINIIGDVPMHENAADYRLVSRRIVELFQTQIRERNQFLRGLFAWVGFRSVGVEFAAAERPAGRTKYSLLRMVRFALDGIVSFSKAPLHLAIAFGSLIAICGLLFGGVIVIDFFRSGDYPPGWATLAILLVVFSGIQLLFLGIVGTYIGAIFDEVKRRPHYLVRERVNFDSDQQSPLPVGLPYSD